MERGELPPEIREYGLGKGYRLFSDKAKLDIWRSNQKGIQYEDKTSGILLREVADNPPPQKPQSSVINFGITP